MATVVVVVVAVGGFEYAPSVHTVHMCPVQSVLEMTACNTTLQIEREAVSYK